MKVFLVGLGLALLCAVNVRSECTEDQKVAEGRWYGTALATDCKRFLNHKDRIKILAIDLSRTKDDTIKLSTTMPWKDKCRHDEKEFTKMDDGTYFHTAERGNEKMEIISTDCTTHAILLMQHIKKKRTTKLLAMHTKERELSPDLKAKFVEQAKNLGFTEDQTVFPSEVACENEE